MKELFSQFFEVYARYTGTGKLLVLFFVSIIILLLIRKDQRGRVHPLLFVVSVWMGIAAGFTALISSVKAKSRTGLLYSVLAVIFLIFAITLSGRLIWSDRFLDSREEITEREADYKAVFDTVLSDNSAPKILADTRVIPYAAAYSSSIEPLYSVPEEMDADLLDEKERKFFEEFSGIHPNLARLKRNLIGESDVYLIIDNTAEWPDGEPEDNDFYLLDTVSHFEIYKLMGGAHE